MAVITLSQRHVDELRRHAEQEYPEECCGLLLGSFGSRGEKIVRETRAISNAREPEARHHRSLILPEELVRGERAARELGLEVIGNYHSHPDHPARPSQFDLEHAWPTWSYVIISVRNGRAESLLSWELKHDRTCFAAEEASIA